jgi:hypothetical protein
MVETPEALFGFWHAEAQVESFERLVHGRLKRPSQAVVPGFRAFENLQVEALFSAWRGITLPPAWLTQSTQQRFTVASNP